MISPQTDLSTYQGRGLVLDTSLLVLLTVGTEDPRLVARHKRTQARGHTAAEFELLGSLIAIFGPDLFSTPHLFTEASNHLTRPAGYRTRLLRTLAALVTVIEEELEPSKEVVRDPLYERFGIADAAIHSLLRGTSSAHCPVVLTEDAAVHRELVGGGFPAGNFTHFREAEGLL